MASPAARKRLGKEFQAMQKSPPPFAWAVPDEKVRSPDRSLAWLDGLALTRRNGHEANTGSTSTATSTTEHPQL